MMRRFASLLCLTFLAAPLLAQSSSSSPPDTSHEAVVFERIENAARFEEDGTSRQELTAVIRVQSQAGVQAFGQLIFGYSSATEKLEIDYVRVRKPDGSVVVTPTSEAQDFAPEILRQAPMYSDYRQRHVSVAGLQAGDVLEYHSITQGTTPLAPHQFWYEENFPRNQAVLQYRLTIDVPKSRPVTLKSPKYKYETAEQDGRRIYTWTLKDLMPKRSPDQSNDDEDDDNDQPDVQLSTFTGWQQVAHWYASLQGEQVQLDDSIRRKAEQLTQGAKTPIEKARRLYDYVALNIRYVSLSFGVGRYQPHLAAEVLKNGYGDCKDKHTLLQALLKAEGIASDPVLISSDHKLDPDVPSPGQFNHVITAARLGQGLTWLDTTSEVAPFELLLYPLRNKQAVLASSDDRAGLVRTPAGAPVANRMSVSVDAKFTETGALDGEIELTAQGDSDVPLREAFRTIPQPDWERVLGYYSSSWGLAGDVSNIRIDPLSDTSKPFHLTYHYHRENFFQVPTSGSDFRVLPAMGQLRKVGEQRKGSEPLDVGPAEEIIYHARIRFPETYSIHIPPNVSMVRDFGEYSSSYSLTKDALDAERRVSLKVNELPAVRRVDYESFRNAASNEVQQMLWCSIKPPSGAALASMAKNASTPEEMRREGEAALERKDFTTAADLLKRLADKDSSQKDVWDELGRAYAGLNQHDDAIKAFRKQIEVDPYQPRVNNDLAAELQQEGKFDEAIAAYQKQIALAASDKLAHKNLGLLFAQLKRDSDARTELETAASIPPEDPEVKMALAQVYMRTGDMEKGEVLMKSVTGVAAPVGAGLYAAALGSGDANQIEHEARNTLDQIGDQFDSGEYDRLGPSAFSAMNLVALGWARLGWAKFLEEENLQALQFLNSAWMLSQSGTVGNRLAQVLEKEGQKDRARHMYALAAAAGGSEAQSSRQQVTRLSPSPAAAGKELSEAAAELPQLRTVKFPGAAGVAGSAQLALVFDASDKPGRVEFLSGDTALRNVAATLSSQEFPVKFPEMSSVKIVLRATLSCQAGHCSAMLQPPANPEASTAAAGQSPKQ